MPDTWMRALQAYRYPVDLRVFADAEQFPGWFQFNLPLGDRNETMAFEEHFRELAAHSIEVWYEVVFWKMYSQKGRRDEDVGDVVRQLTEGRVTAGDLWESCRAYITSPSRKTFDDFRKLFRYRSSSIATVATFPAFADPNAFPMADTRIAKWAKCCLSVHNGTDPKGPQIDPPKYPDNGTTVLTMADSDFMLSWVYWCRAMAVKLSAQTSLA